MAENEEQINEENSAPKEAEIPLMPDITTTSPDKGSFKIKIWLLIILIVIPCIPYYFIYHAGYNSGYQNGINLKGNDQSLLLNDYSKPIYVLDDITVNLRDTDSSKYICTSINLLLNKNEDLKIIMSHEAQIRDSLILLLSKHKSTDLDSIIAYRKLKRLIKQAMNDILGGKIRVKDVYFNKFLIKLLEVEQKIK